MVEYAQYGDVLGYLRKSRGVRDNYYSDPSIQPRTSLTSKQLLKFAWEISDGMDYLSKKKVINCLSDRIYFGKIVNSISQLSTLDWSLSLANSVRISNEGYIESFLFVI